jgi:hypothetical protein
MNLGFSPISENVSTFAVELTGLCYVGASTVHSVREVLEPGGGLCK